VDIDHVLRTLAVKVAEVLPARPEGVWTTWRTLTAYAVGPVVSRQQPAESHDPIVHVYHKRSRDAVERMCQVITDVLCQELGLAPGNVFITVQPVSTLD
jgi:hypothetical protein